MDIIAISALQLSRNVVIVGVNLALVPSSRRHCSRCPCAVAILVVAALAGT
jgi:hypothetical protein